MMKKNRILLILLLITSSLFADEIPQERGQNGEDIFKNNCISCHMMKMGWKLTEKEKSTLLAPTAFGITKHVRDVFSDEKQFVEFVSDYITKPAKIKSRCKDNVVKKFGLMPPIGLGMSDEDKKAVAAWMFNNIGVNN